MVCFLVTQGAGSQIIFATVASRDTKDLSFTDRRSKFHQIMVNAMSPRGFVSPLRDRKWLWKDAANSLTLLTTGNFNRLTVACCRPKISVKLCQEVFTDAMLDKLIKTRTSNDP
jgi:hypothetical protein